MAYAVDGDFELYGLPLTGLGKLTLAQRNACINAASAEMDTHFRARYPLPFISFGVELTSCCIRIAKWYLMNVRGFNAGAPADKQIQEDYKAALAWCQAVQDQKVHPNVEYRQTLEGVQPLVASAKVRGY